MSKQERDYVLPRRAGLCFALDPAAGVYKLPGVNLYCGCEKCQKAQGIRRLKTPTEKRQNLSPLELEVRNAIAKVVGHVSTEIR